MTTYFVCMLFGLLGILLAFSGSISTHAKVTDDRYGELRIIFGATLYFIALFWAAIHSMNGALI